MEGCPKFWDILVLVLRPEMLRAGCYAREQKQLINQLFKKKEEMNLNFNDLMDWSDGARRTLDQRKTLKFQEQLKIILG